MGQSVDARRRGPAAPGPNQRISHGRFRPAAPAATQPRCRGECSALSGAAHLLHRQELPRPYPRDECRRARPAGDLSEAGRCDRAQRWRDPLSRPHLELSLRVRADRRAEVGGLQHRARGCRLAHLRLCGRPRHDAARPSGGSTCQGPAVGDHQGLRSFRAGRPDHAGGADRDPQGRADPAVGQRRGAAGCRHRLDDLGHRRDHRQDLGAAPPRGGRHHHDRDARGRRRGGDGRCARLPCRRARAPAGADRRARGRRGDGAGAIGPCPGRPDGGKRGKPGAGSEGMA